MKHALLVVVGVLCLALVACKGSGEKTEGGESATSGTAAKGDVSFLLADCEKAGIGAKYCECLGGVAQTHFSAEQLNALEAANGEAETLSEPDQDHALEFLFAVEKKCGEVPQ